MSEQDQQKKSVLEAEAVILGLRDEMKRHRDNANGLAAAVEALNQAEGSVGGAARRLDGVIARMDLGVAQLARDSAAAIAEFRSALEIEQEAARRSAETVLARVRDQHAALETLTADVRQHAANAQEQVTTTYTDARSRFERARDEFLDARKEMISAAAELRASLLRLETAEGEFRSAVGGAVKRIERVVYFGVLVAVAALVTVVVAG